MKKSFLIVLLVLFSLPIVAQQRWGGGADYKKYDFTFSFHYVASSFKVFKNDNWSGLDSDLKGIYSPMSQGLGIGIPAYLKLNENLDLYSGASFLFADKQVNYEYKSMALEEEYDKQEVKSFLINLPLTLKFKSDRRDNYRIYLLGGGKYSISNLFSAKEDENSEPSKNPLKLNPQFFSYEFGLGIDIYFEYFKMSPEIKWSQSFGNVLDKSEMNSYTSPIDKLLLRSLQFSLILR
jgi:hypothetical protein